jgi:RNA polymerase sigma-70 factor, ECF subfamily
VTALRLEPVPEEQSETELVLRAQTGDARAMSELLSRHFAYVNAVCRRMLRNPADAEDARQDALIKAARTIATFNHQAAFRTWLHTVTRNVCLNAIRSNARVDVPVDEVPVAEPPAFGSTVERAITTRVNVQSALNAVHPAFRDVLVLCYMCDLEYADIAAALGVPINTVRTQLFRGKAQLIARLRELDEPFDMSDPVGDTVC